MVPSPEMWNTTEVANYLGVKPGTVSAYRHRGQMLAPAQTVGGAHPLVGRHDHSRVARPAKWSGTPSGDPTPRERPDEWLSHGERALYRNEWVTLSLVDVEQPEGEGFEHHVVTMKPAVIVALVSDDGEHVGMVWRHRFAPGVWGWEFPAGLIDGEERPEETAARELAEEQGLTGGTLRHLVSFEPAVGMVRNTHHVYAATGCRVTQYATETNEGGAVEWLPRASMPERIRRGEVPSSGSLVALLHLLALGG